MPLDEEIRSGWQDQGGKNEGGGGEVVYCLLWHNIIAFLVSMCPYLLNSETWDDEDIWTPDKDFSPLCTL